MYDDVSWSNGIPFLANDLSSLINGLTCGEIYEVPYIRRNKGLPDALIAVSKGKIRGEDRIWDAFLDAYFAIIEISYFRFNKIYADQLIINVFIFINRNNYTSL